MTYLAPIKPETDFIDMEDAIHHAADMADVVNSMACDLFAKRPRDETFLLSLDEGNRLMFLAGLAVDMARRVEESYRVAHANYVATKGGATLGRAI